MNLSERMKRYESIYDFVAINKIPVIVRVDGRSFSHYTSKYSKPFDEQLSDFMLTATKHTAAQIDGCVFAYTQSDEASFVLLNDLSLEQEPWFGNRIQKVVSVIASTFTASFVKSSGDLVSFDARFFCLPNLQEVYNYIWWRQQNATRNSIQTATYHELTKKLGRKTAQKTIHGLNTNQQQEALFQHAGLNWNDYPTKFKRGIGLYKRQYEKEINGNKVMRSEWFADFDIPIFNSNREFLKQFFERKK